MNRQVIRAKNFSRAAADFISERARETVAERGEFRIALSGGNTPRPIYSECAGRNLPWERWLFTFGDERCVPPDDEKSNFKMANETWLQPAGVPAENVLRLRGEIAPATAADEYDAALDERAAKAGETIFQHDLILLGLGDDGHTASLFPGTAALTESERRVVANYVPQMQSWRLTFTFPLILAARAICFLIGANKDERLIERVFAGDESLPAARVDKEASNVTWILSETK